MADLFQNVTVTDPASPWNGTAVDLLIENGKITQIGEAGSLKGKGDLLHTGDNVSPGWLDLRTYLTDPGFEYKDTLERVAASALKGGFTAILGHPATHPVADNRELVLALKHRAAELPIHLFIAGALTEKGEGKHLAELYDMYRTGAPAFSDGFHAVRDAGLLMRALQYTQPFGGVIFSLPVDESVAGGNHAAESEAAVRMGLKGIPALAEELQIHRDLAVAEYAPGKLHIGPVTTAAGIALLMQDERKEATTADVSVMHLYFNDTAAESFDTNLKIYPPLRREDDRQALFHALKNHGITAISSGHYPQSTEEKRTDFVDAEQGALTLEAFFGAARKATLGEISEDELIDYICHGPRRILGLPAVTIDVNQPADLTFFNLDEEWIFEEKDNVSMSRNNPFVGREMRGRAVGVYVKGRYSACVPLVSGEK